MNWDHILQAPDMGEFAWEGFGEEGLDKGLLVEEVAEAVGDAGVAEGVGGEGAGAPFGEARLVGVGLVGLLLGVHVEVAVAGLSAGGAPVSAAAGEAEVEEEGGGGGEHGMEWCGGAGEGGAIEGEEEGV